VNRKPLLAVLVLVASVLLIGITTIAVADPVTANDDDLLGKYERSDKEFKKLEIGDKIVYFHQRMIDGAIVEGGYILYQFDRYTKELLDKKIHWQAGLPEHLPPSMITKEQAELMVKGKVQFTKLYIISPESDVFPIKPTPKNPCWVVRSIDNNNITVTIIDAVNGKILGYGIPPPYTGFSLGGPDWDSCDPLYTAWAQNAETWFETMGYFTEMVDCPPDAKVRSHIESTETAMFYELAHGDSDYFHNICPNSERITATEIETWIENYTKMPFTFIGSCGGMCNLGPGTLSYEFRKGSTEDTVTVGYCGMSTEMCSDAWVYSLYWQGAMFNYMSNGNTVKEAFDKAMADYPMCVGCMRFAGDENFAVVPIVGRINQPPNTPLAPTGPDSGSPDTPHYFAAATFDPDGDQVAFRFDWGDGSESSWTSLVDSGSAAGEYHSWSSKGIYEVKVKAKDINNAESGWSEAHTIVINNLPNIPSAPSGPDNGTPGTSHDFTATTTDPDGDQVAFKFDWGDSSQSDWTGFVDSGASAGASHSWANDGTYEVKAKAKDANDAESGWSETHQIVISRPDLTITSISPDAASVDQQVEIIVTITNEGNQDVIQDFFVDVYYDPSSPPDKGQYGDERQQITETVQAGESIEVTFTHTFNSSGDHEVWAQVDADNLVSETDEDNNIYGPHTIAVSERRHENESFSLPAGKWKMISIPFTLDDPRLDAVLVDDLGPQNDAVWKLYRWNTANESYNKYPNVGDFSPGKSFWIISEDAKTVDTGPGTDVSRQTDFVINLPSGWSQIGNPFPFSIDWDEVRVRRNAEVVSILEAQARGWVRDKIWYWDGQSYLVYQAPSGTIDPYEGYWAKALLDCELLVYPDESQQAKAFEQTVNSKEEFLQLKAKVGELEDDFNFLGFSENAKDGYDRLDIEEAPPISPYISLFFPHPEWDKNKGDYTQDIRTRSSQAGLKWTWDFQVKTDQLKKEIILEWENTSVISEELYLYLTDSLSNVLADMREKNSYGFSLSSELESFEIIATYEALPLPEDLNLTEVYSYPNPAYGVGAKFHFHLASWAKVTIKVYTITGELVRTLVEDKTFLPGTYEELWEEKNDKGEKLARGVYIFIVRAGNPAKVISKSGKIALLD